MSVWQCNSISFVYMRNQITVCSCSVFKSKNGVPTRGGEWFLSLLVIIRWEIVQPVPTMAFLQLAKAAAMYTAPLKKMYCANWLHAAKVRRCLCLSLRLYLDSRQCVGGDGEGAEVGAGGAGAWYPILKANRDSGAVIHWDGERTSGWKILGQHSS